MSEKLKSTGTSRDIHLRLTIATSYVVSALNLGPLEVKKGLNGFEETDDAEEERVQRVQRRTKLIQRVCWIKQHIGSGDFNRDDDFGAFGLALLERSSGRRGEEDEGNQDATQVELGRGHQRLMATLSL
jgi:hypothetical protein